MNKRQRGPLYETLEKSHPRDLNQPEGERDIVTRIGAESW